MSLEKVKDEIAERRDNRELTRLAKENYMLKHKTKERTKELKRKGKSHGRDR